MPNNSNPLLDELRIKGACERLGIHEAATDTIVSYMPKVVAELQKQIGAQTTPEATKSQA